MAKRSCTHRLSRQFSGDNYMWRCADCKYFIWRGLEGSLIGRVLMCPMCNGRFQCTQNELTEDILVCPSCRMGTSLESVLHKIKLENPVVQEEVDPSLRVCSIQRPGCLD